jgi:ribosome-binding protein aMBF1 (putative translation factor)
VSKWRIEHPNAELPKSIEDLNNPKTEGQARRQRYARKKRAEGHTVTPYSNRVRLPNLWTHLNRVSQRGLGRDEVAERIGISVNALFAYSQPQGRTCAKDVAQDLAKLLGVTLEELEKDPLESVIRQYHHYVFLPNLNTLRQECGLTWPALSEKVGISKSSLTDYGLGRRRCSPERTQKIATALAVTVEELRGKG